MDCSTAPKNVLQWGSMFAALPTLANLPALTTASTDTDGEYSGLKALASSALHGGR